MNFKPKLIHYQKQKDFMNNLKIKIINKIKCLKILLLCWRAKNKF